MEIDLGYQPDTEAVIKAIESYKRYLSIESQTRRNPTIRIHGRNQSLKPMWCIHWRKDDEECPHCANPDHSPVPCGDSYIGPVWTNDRSTYFNWLFKELNMGAGDDWGDDLTNGDDNKLRLAIHAMPREDIDYIMATKPWITWT